MPTQEPTARAGATGRRETSTPLEAARTDPTGRRPVALVVDDEAMMAAMVAQVIEGHGWQAIIALGSAHAMALVEEHAVDVLVTDLQMPGMSGLGLAQRLRARLGNRLPVLLVSGSPDARDVDMEMPFAFLPKPFALTALIATLNALHAWA